MKSYISFNQAMKLHKEMTLAIKSGDTIRAFKLRQLYPELFTAEFKNFVNDLKVCIDNMYYEYNKDFRNLLE